MNKAEKIRKAASDMGFDDPTDMHQFLDGVGLEVVAAKEAVALWNAVQKELAKP